MNSKGQIFKALKNGNLRQIKELILVNHIFDKTLMRVVIGYGYLDIIKYLVEEEGVNVQAYSDEFINEAVYGENLEIVKYLHKQGCSFKNNKKSLIFAVEDGYLDMVKYLFENGCNKNLEKATYKAAEHGYLEIFKYLVEKNEDIDLNLFFDIVVLNGHLDILEYLVKHDIKPINNNAFFEAIDNGNYDMILYMAKNKLFIY